MSESVRYDYGDPLCTVQENQKLIIEGCDSETIVNELRAANFNREGTRFVKRRSRLRRQRSESEADNEDNGLQVLTVRVIEDTLHVEPSDIVGVVRLLPGMTVQIKPKIEWDDVVQMLLTVYDIDRTQSHYGIPLDDLATGGIEASRIVSILAINYVHGLRTINRKGFIRDLEIYRRNGFEGIGSIDMSQTLLNQASGNPEPAWVETRVEYNNTVNGAIHMAGKLLLRLLQQQHDDQAHPRQRTLFSMVHQEVERMEDLAIQSSQRQLGAYRRVTLGDLPRQRHYYKRALHTSRSILASVLLGQAGSGPEELLVDYALSMNSLFEDYTQRVLAQQLESLGRIDYLDQLDVVECEGKPSVYPLAGNTDVAYYPDHLLTDGKETLAVLDSKYYKREENPVHKTGSRSRMFSYAYLTSTNRMAFLCPLYHRTSVEVNRPDTKVDIVSPDGEFSCEAYESELREYILEVLIETYPELEAFDAVREGMLCLDGVTTADLAKADDPDGPFRITSPSTFANKILSAVTLSPEGPNKLDLERGGGWTKDRIKTACRKEDLEGRPKYPQDRTTCVPVYNPPEGENHGKIALYFIREEDDGSRSIETETAMLL
jgi:5-methylcytosine-specific restriction endonuclease McrBC regulatory subunit McrC